MSNSFPGPSGGEGAAGPVTVHGTLWCIGAAIISAAHQEYAVRIKPEPGTRVDVAAVGVGWAPGTTVEQARTAMVLGKYFIREAPLEPDGPPIMWLETPLVGIPDPRPGAAKPDVYWIARKGLPGWLADSRWEFGVKFYDIENQGILWRHFPMAARLDFFLFERKEDQR